MDHLAVNYALAEANQRVKNIQSQVDGFVIGRTIKILCEWRDQPHGKSRPNLQGKTYEVTGAIVEGYRDVQLWLRGLSCAIPARFVEFL